MFYIVSDVEQEESIRNALCQNIIIKFSLSFAYLFNKFNI